MDESPALCYGGFSIPENGRPAGAEDGTKQRVNFVAQFSAEGARPRRTTPDRISRSAISTVARNAEKEWNGKTLVPRIQGEQYQWNTTRLLPSLDLYCRSPGKRKHLPDFDLKIRREKILVERRKGAWGNSVLEKTSL